MDNLYRDFILEHYRNPHNKGYLDPHDLHFADSNPTCGDEMSMTLRLDQASELVAFRASAATEPLYTVNPFEETGVARMFVTHPPLEERVGRLRELDPGWRDRLHAA